MKKTSLEKVGPEKQLGIKIRQIRRGKSLTQQDLAIKAGFSIQHIGDIERGDANPTLSCLSTLADALDVPIADFFKDSLYRSDVNELRKEELIKFIKVANSENLFVLHSVLNGLK